MSIEAHDARIEQALLDERSQLEDRLHGLMSDALRSALGDDYPDDGLDDLRAAGFNLRPFTDTEIAALDAPLYDETAVLMFDAQLYAIDSPDDLGWDTP